MDAFIYALCVLLGLLGIGVLLLTFGACMDDRRERRAAERNVERMLAKQTGPADGE